MTGFVEIKNSIDIEKQSLVAWRKMQCASY
jgi:hypothetical protein